MKLLSPRDLGAKNTVAGNHKRDNSNYREQGMNKSRDEEEEKR